MSEDLIKAAADMRETACAFCQLKADMRFPDLQLLPGALGRDHMELE